MANRNQKDENPTESQTDEQNQNDFETLVEPNTDETPEEARADLSVADALRESTTPTTETSVDDVRDRLPQTFAMPPEEYKAREMARIKAEAAELNSDETVEGGRYIINDKFYNAHGEELGKV